MKVKMTPDQAKQFAEISKNSIGTILSQRKCSCNPYSDWFTFKRWLAQGMAVRKGEHGIKLCCYAPETLIDDDGKIVDIKKRWYSAYVFCRCQVEPVKSKQKNGAAHVTAKSNDSSTVQSNNNILNEAESFLSNLLAANVSSARGK